MFYVPPYPNETCEIHFRRIIVTRLSSTHHLWFTFIISIWAQACQHGGSSRSDKDQVWQSFSDVENCLRSSERENTIRICLESVSRTRQEELSLFSMKSSLSSISLLWSSFCQFKSQITEKLSIFLFLSWVTKPVSEHSSFFSGWDVLAQLISVAIKVPTGCGSAQFRPVSRMLVLPSWSIQRWKQISTHATTPPFSHNTPSIPDCQPVHLLVPCCATCHRLAARRPAVNRDELCDVRTSLLTRWRRRSRTDFGTPEQAVDSN